MSDSSIRSPRETVELMLRTVTEGSRQDLADLYAPDVRIEIPWSSEGMPAVTEGREVLRARMTATADLWDFDSVQDVVIHETVDPQVVIVEYRVNGTMRGSADKFGLGFVSILRVVDGLIAEARDYGNPLETAELAKYFAPGE